MNPLKLHIIIGTVRPGRAADPVARWVANRASEHGAFEVEVLDLRDWPLPHFAEGPETIGDFADPTYSDPLVKAWKSGAAPSGAGAPDRESESQLTDHRTGVNN